MGGNAIGSGVGGLLGSSTSALAVASAFRFGGNAQTPPASPPSSSSSASILPTSISLTTGILIGGGGGGGGRRRTPSGSVPGKLDLTQKSRSANDVLVDVVGGGGGGDSNDSCARSLNGTSVSVAGRGGGGAAAGGGAKSPALINGGPIMGGRLQFFKGEYFFNHNYFNLLGFYLMKM